MKVDVEVVAGDGMVILRFSASDGEVAVVRMTPAAARIVNENLKDAIVTAQVQQQQSLATLEINRNEWN